MKGNKPILLTILILSSLFSGIFIISESESQTNPLLILLNKNLGTTYDTSFCILEGTSSTNGIIYNLQGSVGCPVINFNVTIDPDKGLANKGEN